MVDEILTRVHMRLRHDDSYCGRIYRSLGTNTIEEYAKYHDKHANDATYVDVPMTKREQLEALLGDSNDA